MKLLLAICTYRRPDGLLRLLDHLRELKLADNSRPALDVVVIDSDIEELAGLAAVDSLDADYPYVIHARAAPAKGISPARNAACREALAVLANRAGNTDDDALIAFLDDDEWPSPSWLAELIRVQQQHDADAVGGPTRSVFPADSDPALADIPYYGADMGLADGESCCLQAGGNFLIRASTLAMLAPDFFHDDFAQSGSEDLAFFMRLASRGARMHWSSEAIVHEDVPADRLDPDWLQHRVVNVANGRIHAAQMLHPGLKASLIRGTKTLALIPIAELVVMAGFIHRPFATKGRLMRWRGRGKLLAHFGVRTERREIY